MKKNLGKKTDNYNGSIEAYACSCSGCSCNFPSCTCDALGLTSNDTSNNNFYSATVGVYSAQSISTSAGYQK